MSIGDRLQGTKRCVGAAMAALALAGCASTRPMPGERSAPASEESGEDLARKLTNPVADLVSLPLQVNLDREIGPRDDGERTTINMQPVLPFQLNDDWNLISRTIVPIVHQDDILPGSGHQLGLGDALASAFFSPTRPADGWIWGAGPAALVPTASDELLGGEKWGLGPTAVALKQEGRWTFGALANHVWSIAGESSRDDVDQTFVQPFTAYTTPDAWTFLLNVESTYDWEDHDLAIPLHAQAAKLARVGRLPVSFFVAARWWLEEADGGPEGLGARFGFTVILPRSVLD